MAKDRRQATNTLALPGVNSGFGCFTVIIPKNGRTEDDNSAFEKSRPGD
jgi:hypothetical protein